MTKIKLYRYLKCRLGWRSFLRRGHNGATTFVLIKNSGNDLIQYLLTDGYKEEFYKN